MKDLSMLVCVLLVLSAGCNILTFEGYNKYATWFIRFFFAFLILFAMFVLIQLENIN